ncbi:HYR-like domain-containing protein, partial [Maribellus mangrovi]|uniref:HYR-like domain-containing protein n=1 Tax=Maribellus mangrovi TaxID=3133146 RepID=UPI0030EEEC25
LVRTYTVSDGCAANDFDLTMTYSGSDRMDPEFISTPQTTLTITCDEGVPTPPEITATDNCDSDVEVIYEELTNSVSDGCGQIVRRWTAVDDCGNDVSFTQTITVEDNTLPVLTVPDDTIVYSDLNCSYDTDTTFTGAAMATDNCDPDPTLTFVDRSCFGTDVSFTLTANDAGNIAEFDISGLDNLKASDIKNLALSFSVTQGVGNAEFWLIAPSGQAVILVGPYCNSTSICGTIGTFNANFSESASITWDNTTTANLVGDFKPYGDLISVNTVPGVTLVSGFDEFTGDMNGTWRLFGRKQKMVGGNGTITFNNVCLTPALSGCEYNEIFVRRWTASDNCGNTIEGQQVIQVVDSTGPVVYIPNDTTVDCENIPALPTVTAYDNCSGDVPVTYIGADTLYEQSCFDQFTIVRTWSATDDCGNLTNKTQRISVENCCNETVDAGEDITVCEGNEVIFFSSEVPEAISYVWEGPDGYSQTGQNPPTFNATLASDGIYVITVEYGCSCVAKDTLVVNVIPKPEPITTNVTICSDETYTWSISGVEYLGTDGDTTVRYEGDNCAADTVLNVSVNDDPDPLITNVTICSDETYTWDADGVEYLGTDGDTTVHYEGLNCAPDTVLNVTVIPEPDPIVTNVTICSDETYTWDADGVEYLGTEGDTTVHYEGADCAADTVLNVTVIPEPDPIVTNVTICSDETYTWDADGVEYLGTEGDTTVHYEGADCAADTVLNVTVTPEPDPIVTNVNICSDETYTWDADGLEYLGTDGDTTVHYEGADCAADTVLNVTVTPEPAPIVTNVNICSDETYTWDADGVEYLGTDGDITVHYEGLNCAADTVLNITVTPEPDPIVTNVTICSDETYTWDTDGLEYLGADGDTTVHYEGLNCAPDTALNVTVTPEPDPIVTNVTICSDETYTWDADGVEYLGTDGDTTVHYEGADCAADTVLNVSVNDDPDPLITNVTICSDETYTWDADGVEYLGTDGDTTVHYEGADCAADTVLNITVTPEPDPIVTNVTICSDETYTWDADGVEYLGTDGDTTVHYEGADCAADTVLNVTVTPEPDPIVTNVTICSDETYTWDADGMEYLGTDGDTNVHYEGLNCAPDTVLNVTVTPEPDPIVTNVTICSDETYTWDADGMEYLGTDGDTNVHYEGLNCAPDTVLNVTVTPEPDPIVTNVTICSDETYT